MKTGVPRILTVLSLVAAGVAEAPAQDAQPADYGRSKEQAIEVCRPDGERAYLARLVCPDRSHPKFERFGSVGPRSELPADMTQEQMMQLLVADRFAPLEAGAADHHMIDGYSVRCGKTEATLYLDMYHCHVPPPDAAPEGFTIIR